MSAILETRALSAAYGPTRVLQSIDLSVPERGIVTLLGANGAGKTTTLRALCNMMVRVSGEIRFEGQRIDGKATEDIVRLGIGHVPDGRGTLVSLSVEENLRLGAYTRRDARVAQDFERVYSYFPRLKERRRQQAGTLSGGEQQMLAISRALAGDTRVLLLDEISMGLAPIIVAELYELVGQIAQTGVTVLLVEQFAETALGIADRAAIMLHGRVAHEGTPQDMARMAESAYL